MKNELKILNEIKEKLLDKGKMSVYSNGFDNEYTLQISSEDWHNIFKTDEYNEAKK